MPLTMASARSVTSAGVAHANVTPTYHEVGIPAGDGLHTLRHYYASLLIRRL